MAVHFFTAQNLKSNVMNVDTYVLGISKMQIHHTIVPDDMYTVSVH